DSPNENDVLRCKILSTKMPFPVDQLSVHELLKEWRWLCDAPVTLLARTAFGDLFLRRDDGKVFKLDITTGQLTEVAETVDQFLAEAAIPEKEEEWFAMEHERNAAKRGLVPGREECIAFKIPLVFSGSAAGKNNAYVGNLYEFVSFMGKVHRQIANVPDGA